MDNNIQKPIKTKKSKKDREKLLEINKVSIDTGKSIPNFHSGTDIKIRLTEERISKDKELSKIYNALPFYLKIKHRISKECKIFLKNILNQEYLKKVNDSILSNKNRYNYLLL